MRLRHVLLLSSITVAAPAALAPLARAEGDLRPSGGEVSFHLGVHEPRGDSELWTENESLFTQDVTDFDDLVNGIAFASRVNRYLDILVGAEYYGARDRTKYRDFFFANGDPIRHTTRLREIPIDVSLKFLPIGRTSPRGESGRRHLRPVIPYIGGGAGGMLWDYREEGQFLDLTDPNTPVLFNGDFHARGVTGSYHALAGVEVQFSPEVALQLEGRYRWAKDRLGSDFVGFDRFDLSGGSLNVGLGFRF